MRQIKWLVICLLGWSSLAFGNDESLITKVKEQVSGVWALGASHQVSNYKGVDSQLGLTPLVFGRLGPVFIEANRASYSIYRDGTWFGSLVGHIRNHQYKEADELSGEKKRALELGGQIGRRLGDGVATRLALVNDVSGAHQSYELDWQLYKRQFFGDLALLTAIGVQHQSAGLVDYYYGTDTFKGEAGQVIEREAIATYYWNDWAAFAGVRYYQFGDNVNDSPLVEGKYTSNLFSGIGFSL